MKKRPITMEGVFEHRAEIFGTDRDGNVIKEYEDLERWSAFSDRELIVLEVNMKFDWSSVQPIMYREIRHEMKTRKLAPAKIPAR